MVRQKKNLVLQKLFDEHIYRMSCNIKFNDERVCLKITFSGVKKTHFHLHTALHTYTKI
jgi:hypothetical protein